MTAMHSSQSVVRMTRPVKWPTGRCQCVTWSAFCLLLSQRALQFFFFATIALLFPAAPLFGAVSIGSTHSLNLVDINGHKLSTTDGHVTVLVLTTTADREKARA